METQEQDQSESTLEVEPFGDDREGFVGAVERLLVQTRKACSGYVNSSSVVRMSEQCVGENDTVLERSFGLDLKDLLVLAAITQAPLSLRGVTDCGKTALAELGLNALLGRHGKKWWRAEISRGMSEDDMIDINVSKLKKDSLSKAVSAAEWLAYPGRLLDEINRAPAKLNNILLHLIDGSGLHLRGGLHVPVGQPYGVGGSPKRYSYTITTANEQGADYDGTFAEDMALLRRIVLSVNLDHLAPSVHDVARLIDNERPGIKLPECESMMELIVRVYESLPGTVPLSPLARLFLVYLSGLGNCVRTRSGRMRPELQSELCKNCHLSKANRFCGHVGGLSSGLLLWTKDLSKGLAAIRAAKLLLTVREDCESGRLSELREFLASDTPMEELYEAFRSRYLTGLSVCGEDIVCAYGLIAPHHVYIDREWLNKQASYERSEHYAFADIASSSWEALLRTLSTRKALFGSLAKSNELSAPELAEIETLVTTENAAMLSVISLLREEDVPLKLNEATRAGQAA